MAPMVKKDLLLCLALNPMILCDRHTTVCGNIRGMGIVLRVPQENVSPTNKGLRAWIDFMKLKYDIILLLQHILYNAPDLKI